MIEELKKLGLTEYELKVYLTLLRIGSSRALKICKESGVPHGLDHKRGVVGVVSLVDQVDYRVPIMHHCVIQVNGFLAQEVLHKRTFSMQPFRVFTLHTRGIQLQHEQTSLTKII